MQSAWCIKSALFLLQCHKSLQVTSVIMPRKFRHYRPKCSEKKRALYYIIRVNKKLARDDSSAIKVKFHLYYEKRGLNIPHWNRTELKSYIRRNARIMYCAHTVSNPFPSTIYGRTDRPPFLLGQPFENLRILTLNQLMYPLMLVHYRIECTRNASRCIIEHSAAPRALLALDAFLVHSIR